VAINDGDVPFIGGIRSILRFFGSGVTVRDDKPGNKINIEITGGGGGGGSALGEFHVSPTSVPGPLVIPLVPAITPKFIFWPTQVAGIISMQVIPAESLPIPIGCTDSYGKGLTSVTINSFGAGVINCTINSVDVLGTAATGYVSQGGATGINDGTTFTLSDGVITRTFEFDKNGSVTSPNIPVPIVNGQTKFVVSALLTGIVNDSDLDITATDYEGQTDFTNNVGGILGNVEIILGGPESAIGSGGMSGGSDAPDFIARVIAFSNTGGGGGGFELAANGEVDAAKACNAADSRLGGGGGGFELAADGEVDATKACNAADSRLVGISPSRGRRTWTGSIELPASTLTGDYPMLQSESPYFRPRRIEMFAYDPNDPTQFSHGVALVTMPIGQEEATGQFAMRNSCHLQDRMSVNELGLEIGIDESMHGDGWRGTARYSLDDGFVLHLIKFGNGRDLYIKVFAEG